MGIKCIGRTDGTNLDLVISMYNLIEYSSNYLEVYEVYGSLWFYSKEKANDLDANIAKLMILNLLNIKLKLNIDVFWNIVADRANGILEIATIAIPLKYLSNFRRSLEMPLINCKL